MRLNFFPLPLLVGLVLLVVVLAILRRRKHSASYLVCFALFGLYLLLVVSVTLFPIPLVGGGTASRQPASYILARMNLTPFYYGRLITLSPGFVFWREIVANILMTVPFGFGISFITHLRAKHIPWLALGVGFGIEAAQLGMCLLLGMAYRGVDINDALTNALGVLLGYGVFRVFSWQYVTITRRFKLEHRGLFAYVYKVMEANIV